jgi:uncharacterized OB-fold protein
MSEPLPVPTPRDLSWTKKFWEATGEGRLLLTKCDECDAFVWYPRPFCPLCGSLRVSDVQASGKGAVYTFTVVHRAADQGYKAALPYVVAYIELEEGPRILSNVIGCEPNDVRIGMPVAIVFQETGQGSALYRFQPA